MVPVPASVTGLVASAVSVLVVWIVACHRAPSAVGPRVRAPTLVVVVIAAPLVIPANTESSLNKNSHLKD